jgi:arabinofuranosyltransferase
MWRFGVPLLLVVLVLCGAFTFINYTTDDPFITFRYADNIVAGEGPVYNPGERVEGYSNPTWLLLMTAASALLPDDRPLAMLWVAKFLGVVLTVCMVLVVYAAERRALPDRLPVASLFLAANPCLWVWSVSGLEAPLCAFLIATVLYDEVVKGGTLTGATAIGLLAVSRPEMPLLLIVYLAYRWVETKAPPWRNSAAFLLAVAPFLAYFGFRVWFFLDIFPNTYYAKAASHDWAGGFGYLWQSLRQFHMYWTMLPLLVIGLVTRRGPGRNLALVFLVAYTLFIVASGGDWMPAARF